MIKYNNFEYFDTHCHLDLYTNYKSVVEESKKNKTLIVAMTNIPSVFKQDSALFKYSDNVVTDLGLHPQLAKQYGGQVKLFEELLPETQFVGEIGLDDPKDNEQRKIFEHMLRAIARYKNKVISIHSRNSAEEVVSMMGPNYPGNIIMHWFSGSSKVLKEAIKNGYLLSVNPSMTLTKNGQHIIQSLPLDRILTETDGPFTKIDERTSVPTDVRNVTEFLAKIHNKTTEDINRIIQANFSKCVIPK